MHFSGKSPRPATTNPNIAASLQVPSLENNTCRLQPGPHGLPPPPAPAASWTITLVQTPSHLFSAASCLTGTVLTALLLQIIYLAKFSCLSQTPFDLARLASPLPIPKLPQLLGPTLRTTICNTEQPFVPRHLFILAGPTSRNA